MSNSFYRYFGLAIVILSNLTSCIAQNDAVCHSDGTSSCESDDLNHSILIECDSTACPGLGHISAIQSIDWPSKPGEIVLVQSSRAGARLALAKLVDLDYEEDDQTRMLDINTTLYIDTKSALKDAEHRKLMGFGATIDLLDLDQALRTNKFDRLYGAVFAALFGPTEHGARFNLMRLLVDTNEDTNIDLSKVLLRLDDELNKQPYKLSDKLRIVVEVKDTASRHLRLTMSESVQTLINLDFWALASEKATSLEAGHHYLPAGSWLRSIELDRTPDILDGISLNDTDGLLIRSKPSTPYEYLQYTRNLTGSNMRILSVGRAFPKTVSPGDWQNAQDSAIELMNLLKYGSDGYMEDRSIADVLRDLGVKADASLYSLHGDHGFHLRGPKFYTTAHFSRYLKMGSRRLETDLFTQPNMFAAHYSAFMTSDTKHIVCIVSNENEHLLPLRLAIDRRIKTLIHLEPKSINTFLINLA